MVVQSKLIVDVDFALHDSSRVLRDIKSHHPLIAQLFHAKKSHHVHIVGPAVAWHDILQAAEDVLGACGEPFHLSADDAAALAQLIFVIGVNSLEEQLRKLFGPFERFASDDKVRVGWQISGPMYGICAQTSHRRRQLMEQCLDIIHREYRLKLTLLPTTTTTTTQYFSSHMSTPITSTPSSQGITPPLSSPADSFGPPTGGDIFSLMLQDLNVTAIGPPTEADSSPTRMNAMNDPTAPSSQWSVVSNNNTTLTAQNSSACTASRYVENAISDAQTMQPHHHHHNEAEDAVAGGMHLQLSSAAEAPPHVPPPSQAEGNDSVGLHGTTPRAFIDHDTLPVLRDAPDITATSSERHAVILHPQVLLVPIEDMAQRSVMEKEIGNLCATLGVVASVARAQGKDCLEMSLCDAVRSPEHSNVEEEEGLAPPRRICDAVGIARDRILSKLGAGPIVIHLLHPTELQRRLLLPQQKKTNDAVPNRFDVKSKRVTATQRVVDVTCRSRLLHGESIDVTYVELWEPPDGATAIRVKFVLKGLKGRGLPRRVASITAFVEECLCNVHLIGESSSCDCSIHPDATCSKSWTTSPLSTIHLEGAPNELMTTLADMHDVYVSSRTLLHDDTVARAVVVGANASLSAFAQSVKTFARKPNYQACGRL
ncbi:Hypothetical protein, putative [Bodo saltans]|uniref:Uncharacterized protein n=1 Tax=Bodo saltans TaxID=75058 RepID=A0A0S4IYY8_BODSA|nr:Hypothetical protein, putative [Bodo saltans]|eukprot:CUG19823.1 Hypothetical protein, putative [Bodo saltans]